MKTIFITITRGSLVRNFFITGMVGNLLKANIRVIVLSPFENNQEVFRPFQHKNLIIEPLVTPPTTFVTRLVQEFFKGAIFNKTVHTRYLHRITAAETPPSRKWYIPRMVLFAPLCLIPGFKSFIRWIDLHFEPQEQNDYLFEKYHPNLVFSTTPHGSSDISVLKGAKRFGVKSMAMPKSWDTLSKLLFSVKADHLLVWSEYTKQQARKYQGYKEHEVTITGAPQFDCYANKKLLMSREDFCARMGLDPKKKYILYGSTGSHSCYEAHYVDLLKKYIDEGSLSDVSVLIRPHIGYLGDGDQFAYFSDYPGFIVDTQDKQDSRFKDNWDISEGHLSHLFNSLYHAAVCVNVGSTLSIDATMSGTPVININFDADPNVDKAMSVRRLYKSDYVAAIAEFGGTWLAKSEPEYLDALQRVVVKGERKKEGMKKLISYFAYANDGKAAERIAMAIQKYVV